MSEIKHPKSFKNRLDYLQSQLLSLGWHTHVEIQYFINRDVKIFCFDFIRYEKGAK